ncbi:MAG: hydrogen gas-evolving membrane-bound hydrogenase subunit E [Bacillota bacterium]|nr:hydrogen gas-evolving membrane-bound hydrogenase subunit E [Bacillota bacterium]
MSFKRILFYTMSITLVAMISFMLMLAVTEMPVYGNLDNPTNNELYEHYVTKGVEESGGTNLVANILLDYRGYDTLLESTVLFSTVIAIMLVWGTRSVSKEEEHEENIEEHH